MTESNPKNNILNLCEKEHSFLRNELAHLKDCQIKFLTFSVTATALILGIGRSSLYVSNGFKSLPGEMWLIPLLVLLPAWWIFFDKATTITRIVGYFRQLEKIMLQKALAANFLGWENALAEFRKCPIKVEISKNQISYYWLITYCTFFFLSLFCLLMGWKASQNTWVAVATLITLFSIIWNGKSLWGLIRGKYSYNANEEKWRIILGITDIKEAE